MSDIEWTDQTWTPFRAWGNEREALGWACEKVSEGCQHCYAETINRRLGTGLPYSVKAVEKSGGEHYLDEKALLKPLSWKRPRRIFVSSMTDIFGEWVPFDWLDRVFAVMALTPQHTYQVLTKRPERMREYLTNRTRPYGEAQILYPTPEWVVMSMQRDASPSQVELSDATDRVRRWPLPNVWLGTSVENQHWADIRIPELLATPAAVRFLSCEPLLGPLDLGLTRFVPSGVEYGRGLSTVRVGHTEQTGVDWVIVGGESGPKARPFDLAWARSIVSQCRAAGVAVFVKQLGRKPFESGSWEVPREVSLEALGRVGAAIPTRLKSSKGGDMAEWPEDLRVREWPR